MNLSYRWLLEVAPEITDEPAALAKRLVMLGAEVDRWERLSEGMEDIVVARVARVRAHPNADRLRLCEVEDGGDDLRQIVCGAPVIEEGGLYPLAPAGGALPDGTRIRRTKLRGERSEGMLCSARELGLGRDAGGIMRLEGSWEPGTPLTRALELDDVRFHVEVTPNRPDLLHHVGTAAELAPDGWGDIELPIFPGAPLGHLPTDTASLRGETGGVAVRVDAPEHCPHYACAVIRGVRIGASPAWLAARLRSVGLRPVNNVVDATNYMLYELGQPLHAFDLDRLAGPQIVVREASAGESLRTLDGEVRALGAGTLVIADAEQPVALAGVMGGEESEVGPETRNLFLECARFAPGAVRASAGAHGLSTDASYRFERGIDPESLLLALDRTIKLIRGVAGGRVDGPVLSVEPEPFVRSRILLRPARVERVLGVALPASEIDELLGPIGFEVEPSGTDGRWLTVDAPGSRPDVTREIDLIEELARRRGYDSFSDEPRPFRGTEVREDAVVAVERAARDLFTRAGFLEARTLSFAGEQDGRVPLSHPLSSDESHLRDALLPGLMRRLEYNYARGERHVRLFEVGTVFRPSGSGERPNEERHAAAVLTGAARPPHWSGTARAWDIWDVRGLMEEVLQIFFGDVDVSLEVGESPAALPLEARATLRALDATGDAVIWGGRVAAGEVDAPAWADAAWGLEIRLPVEGALRTRRSFVPLPAHPAVERDLALLVPDKLPAREIERTIREEAGETLERLAPFDVYTGSGVPEGTRSLAWRLRFRKPERTLRDEEVDPYITRIVAALEERHGVSLR